MTDAQFVAKFQFTTPFRYGGDAPQNAAEPRPTMPSDALSAALVSTWASYQPGEIDSVAETPPFIVSDLMPWIAAGQQRRYLVPVPVTGVQRPDAGVARRKEIEKIRWITPSLLNQHEALPDVPVVQGGRVAVDTSFGEAIEDDDSFWSVGTRSRIAVPRVDAPPDVWSTAGVHFRCESGEGGLQSGLYALVRVVDQKRAGDVRTVFSILADEGIGAQRTAGMGAFDISFETWPEWMDRADGSRRLLMSHFSPADDEVNALQANKARYECVRRRGWITARGLGSFRRKNLHLVRSGSILPDEDVTGQVRDVTPEVIRDRHHPIYRDGRAVTLAFEAQNPRG